MDNQIPPVLPTAPAPCCSPKNKLVCLSAGLAVLVIVGIVAFALGRSSNGLSAVSQILPTPTSSFATPTPDPTANWKTYRNKEYGFEFKYPENQDNKNNPIKGSPFGCQKLGSDGTCVSPEGYEFGLIRSCSGADCDNWVAVNVFLSLSDPSYTKQMNDFTGSLSNTKLINSSLGGLSAKKRVSLDGTDIARNAQQFYVSSGKNNFVIYADLSDSQTYQILSTFKFLDQNQADPTSGWQTFQSADVTFKYPAAWTKSGDFALVSTDPKIRVVVIPKGNTLMNECMKETSVETRGLLTIKKFSRVTTGAMCATADATPREIWVIPSPDASSPGISYEYLSTQVTQAESLFNQILATLKFLP